MSKSTSKAASVDVRLAHPRAADGLTHLHLICGLVGLTGFEPATPCPPDKCANQAALQPAIADDRPDRNALRVVCIRGVGELRPANAKSAWGAAPNIVCELSRIRQDEEG